MGANSRLKKRKRYYPGYLIVICTPFSGQPEKGVFLCVIHTSISLNALNYFIKEGGRRPLPGFPNIT
ncbi:MAG: hypothetical protein J5487_03065, partial [Lachnospiraceae bacterium]|nr:hypothetical protein [Lachnospiraceae bacterium]